MIGRNSKIPISQSLISEPSLDWEGGDEILNQDSQKSYPAELNKLIIEEETGTENVLCYNAVCKTTFDLAIENHLENYRYCSRETKVAKKIEKIYFAAMCRLNNNPATFKEAMTCSKSRHWREAVCKEIDAQLKICT